MGGYAGSESFINASVSDEKLDKILQLYDYLLSDEGALLSTYGSEGDTNGIASPVSSNMIV